MSKLETIQALMESAILCFAKDGYDGASLRDIARNADVPLSTIHFYFGSKGELYLEVVRHAWAEIDKERGELLEQALAAGDARAPQLSALVYALAYPIVRRALSKNARDIGQIYILRSHTSHSQPSFLSNGIVMADRSMVRWIDAITLIHPTLSRPLIIWGFSFIVGAIYSWQVIDHRYDSMLGDAAERDAEDVTNDLVSFCTNGFEALANRHRPRPAGAANRVRRLPYSGPRTSQQSASVP